MKILSPGFVFFCSYVTYLCYLFICLSSVLIALSYINLKVSSREIIGVARPHEFIGDNRCKRHDKVSTKTFLLRRFSDERPRHVNESRYFFLPNGRDKRYFPMFVFIISADKTGSYLN